MAVMEGGGIRIDLPNGWDAEIYRRVPEATVLSTDGTAERTNAVMHAANFAMPVDRGDFGSGAVEVMTTADVLVILFEYNPEDSDTALFAHEGMPLPLIASDFGPNNMQRPLKGLLGVQHFFRSAGRAWCLYVVLSEAARDDLVAAANEVLATVDLDGL